MLVLSRKKNETIVIGETVATITVVEIRGDKVRLGIEADRSLPVHRGEVQAAIERNREPSLDAAPVHLDAHAYHAEDGL